MPKIFLQEEFIRIPVAIQNSWPLTTPSWIDLLFMADAGAIFASMDERGKLEYCNTQLRFHMSCARWYGRWKSIMKRPGRFRMADPPHGVPELALLSSLTFMVRAVYGAAFYYGDFVHCILTAILATFLTTLMHIFINEDAPIFVGWRTLDIANCDVDQVQLSTRTTWIDEQQSALYRLSVIYSRFVWGTLVFRRKYSEAVRYRDLLDISGRFDALKFEEWIRGVIYNAMTVPHGSVWSFRHLTLT